MDKHGFERIDEVLVDLVEELDVTMKKKASASHCRSNKRGVPLMHDMSPKIDGASWIRNGNLEGLYERMNARFETVANRIKHS
ncbi:hypothetical protein N9Z87_01650 [Amylibacter sp.]|nr:hypothetical protein [Amylibacter sp.]